MSNTIYNKKKYHYTYWIINNKEYKYYIGVRSCDIHPVKDLGFKYFSSSTDDGFMKDQKVNPQDYEYRVCSIFESRKLASLDEIEQHDVHDVGKNSRFYNKVKQKSTYWDPYGKTAVFDESGKIIHVDIDDPKFLSGKYKHVNNGKCMVRDKDGKIYSVKVNDPRVLSGELVSTIKGKVPVRDLSGHCFLVDVDDTRRKTGELRPAQEGLVNVYNEDGKIIKVSITDPKFISGEYVHFNKGLFAAKDKDGNSLGLVSTDDPRYKSGEIVGPTSKHSTYVNNSNEKLYLSTSDPRVLSGELTGINKNKVIVSIDSINRWIPKDDPRVISGELKYIFENTAFAIDVKTNEKLGRVRSDDPKWKTKEIVGMTTGYSSAVKGTCPAKNSITGESIGRVSIEDPRWETGEICHPSKGLRHKAKREVRDYKDNDGNIVFARFDDPRVLTGELHGRRYNTSNAVDVKTNEKLGMISKDDPRWKSGEIVTYSSLYTIAKDKDGNSLGCIAKTDPRWITGEIVSTSKNNASARDARTGMNLGRVSKDDPRWKTGEIISSNKGLKYKSAKVL